MTTFNPLLQQINEDRALGSAILFKHRHKQDSPTFHIQIMDMWRAQDPLVVIQAFREGAKTTLSEEFLLMEAAFTNFKYALIFGETYTKACQRVEAIKHEVHTNAKLHALFGSLKGAIWSENRISLKNGTLLEAHGWEEEIRGYKHLDMRPDRAYLDDIENKERVRDTNAVNDNWKKLHLQLIPAMDIEGKVRMTGTPLADDCMVRRAEGSQDWVSGKFPICDGDIDDPNTKSTWPDRYPMTWIRAKRDHYQREGMLREFNQEYMLVATGSQGKPFTDEMMAYTDVEPATYTPKITIIDPARTTDIKKSDQSGHVTVSKIGTRIYVHESGGEFWQPDELVSQAYAISERHESQAVIEKNSLDDWLLQPIRAYGLMTGQQLDLKPVQAPQDRDKTQFIMGLRPFFIAGDIIFVGGKSKHAKLISQVINFPTGRRDILNALAYVLKVFAGVAIYPEFGEANIVDGHAPGRADNLLLGCNATGSETAVSLVSSSGRHMVVLADWISPLMPNDSIPDIVALVRQMYRGRGVTAWVPAEVFDQIGRNPLVAALKACGLQPNRGESTTMGRGALSPSIRTSMHNRRMFLVDRNARNTLQAMTLRYNFPVKSGGERMSEPERGPSRTLIEGIETLVAAVEQTDQATTYQTNALNSHGVGYMSALKR